MLTGSQHSEKEEALRRAERLFEIIQILRQAQRPVTAAEMSQTLEVSERTVYRDIAALIGQRVPIQGEAGVGYALRKGYDLPPLMFTADEIETLILAAQLVGRTGDPALSRRANHLIGKIEAILPEPLKKRLRNPHHFAPDFGHLPRSAIDLDLIRNAIEASAKARIAYRDKAAKTSERVIWPIALAYFNQSIIIGAWCELRSDFRHFRADGIERIDLLDETYAPRNEVMLGRYLDYVRSIGEDI